MRNLTFILALLLLASCSKTGAVVADEPIKIGVIVPLIGPFAPLGTEFQRGVQLAFEEATSQGLSVKVLYEDDIRITPSAVVAAGNKLINVDTVDVGITMIIEESKPVASMFEGAQTPLIVMWDANEHIKESGEYLYSTGFSTELAGQDVADLAFDQGLRRIAILRHLEPWAQVIAPAFTERFQNLGGTIVLDEDLPMDTVDFRTTILKIPEADGVFFAMFPTYSNNFVTQVRQFREELVLFTGDAFTMDMIEAAGPAAEGVFLANVHAEQATILTEKYKERFGVDPIAMRSLP